MFDSVLHIGSRFLMAVISSDGA